jgi:protein O-GlcNAc transferase
LGRIAYLLGRFKIAALFLSKAAVQRPEEAAIHSSLGVALSAAGLKDQAIASFRRALEINPGLAKAYTGLGLTFMDKGLREDAITSFRRALEIDPSHVRAVHGLGVALLHEADREGAIECFRRAVALAPGFAEAQAGILFALHYVPRAREDLFSEAIAWGQAHADPLTRAATPHTNSPDAKRRLRVGYVSADLHNHPVGYFLEAVLTSHNRDQVEVFCYTNDLAVDSTTQRLRAAADHWRIIWGMMDEAAAQTIRSDGIDILVDLSGHTAGSRLLLFARKPAPIQVSWLGYFDTTGARAMDYIIADRYVCPEEDDRFYVERVLRLPDTYLCYTPPAIDVPVANPPSLSTGAVTFGCFNNITKVTPEVVAVWAQILRRIPGARLVLKSGPLSDETVRHRYTALFGKHGIGPERLELHGHSAHGEYLAAYGQIDVALDPFPYNGGTTTVEALWMGVPVVALRGDRFVSRMCVTHLTSAGLEGLIAETMHDYVEKAVALATDPEQLVTLRATLRQRLQASPLCDAARFTGQLEEVYRRIWQEWCDTRHGEAERAFQ